MRFTFAVFMVYFLLGGAACATPGTSISSFNSESGQIDILGRTNVNSFSLSYPLTGSVLVADKCEGTSVLRIPIEDFETESSRLKSDFEELLKSDDHPHIAIQFSGINDLSPENESNHLEMTISLAGVSKQFEIPCTIDTFSSENVCISGHVSIDFSEFSLDPPVKFLGLVRVDDRVDVLFQVNLKSQSTAEILNP